MDVRATLLWSSVSLSKTLISMAVLCLVPITFHIEKLPGKGKKRLLFLESRCWRQFWVIFVVDTSMVIHECCNGYYATCSAMCVFFIGSSFQAEHLFSLQVACNCLPGYSGDGMSQCNPINLCQQVCLHFAVTRGEDHSLEASLFPNT